MTALKLSESQDCLARWLVAVFIVCCGTSCSPNEVADEPIVAFKDARTVVVEIDYMPRAEPAVSSLTNGLNPWLIFQDNLRRILPHQVEAISKTPMSLHDMGMIAASPRMSLDDQEILALAAQHRDYGPAPDGAYLHILFLDAEYRDSSGSRPDVRANHVQDTPVIAVFGGAGSNATDLEKVLEQAALLHEVGHAFGLVGEGVADLHNHTDPDSPGHCAVESCVMSAKPRNSQTVLEFVQGQSNSVPVLFDEKCLDDLALFYASNNP